jgi:hypothetical protein
LKNATSIFEDEKLPENYSVTMDQGCQCFGTTHHNGKNKYQITRNIQNGIIVDSKIPKDHEIYILKVSIQRP